MFNTDQSDSQNGLGIVPRKKFAAPALPMPQVDQQPDGPPNPFEKALAMGTALGNTPPPDSGVVPAKPKLGAPPAATDTPAPKLGAAPSASPDGSAAVAQGTPKLGAASGNAQEIPAQSGITRKPFFSAAERGIKNPIFRTLAEIGDVAGSSIFPGAVSMIPGTRLNEERGQDRDLAQQKEQAEIAGRNAQAAHLNSETQLAGQPKPKEEEWTVVPGMTGPNGEIVQQEKNSGTIRFAQGMTGVKPLKTPAEKEGEMPLGDKINQANKMLEQRWQIRHPNQPLSPTYTLPPNATQKDYERIDKALEAEERANGTKAQQDTANEMRKQTFALMQQAHADSAAQHGSKPVLAYDKDNKAHLLSAEDAKAAGLTGITEATPKQIDDAKTHTVVLNDMQTKLNDVVSARKALDQDTEQRAIISKVLAHAEPGVINDQINKFALNSATEETKEYIRAVQSLKESALGLPKEITGGSRTSELQGNALFQTLPTGSSLDSDYALEQSKKFQANIDRLRERVPEVRDVKPTTPHNDLNANTLKPPKEPDAGMKWQHRTANGKTEWRQVPAR